MTAKPLSLENSLVINLCSDLYVPTSADVENRFRDINWVDFVQKARANKVLFHVLSNLLKKEYLINDQNSCRLFLETEYKKCEKAINKLFQTLKWLEETFCDKPYLFVKTSKDYLYVTHDVDVLVPDLDAAKILFKDWQPLGSIEPYKFSFKKSNSLEVELHKRVSWGSLGKFYDDDLPWKNTRRVSLGPYSINVPSKEAEILIMISHQNYQQYEIQIGELLYLYKLFRDVDWNIIAEQTEKYKWMSPFNATIQMMNLLHWKLFNFPSASEKYIQTRETRKHVNLDFPLIPPFPHFLKALVEKGDSFDFLKIGGYFERYLSKFPELQRAYDKIILSAIGEFFFKNFLLRK